jgi:MFS family permease
MSKTSSKGFRDTPAWYLGFSAYSFATSYKWFILFLLLPAVVADIVPEGEKNSAWGSVVSVGAAWAMIGPAIFGNWSDKFRSRWGRRRPFIAVGAVLTIAALLFLPLANTLPLLILAYLLLQVSDDVATGPYYAIVADAVPALHRGKANGYLNLLGQVAQILAVIVGLVLGKPLPIFLTIAALHAIGAIITLNTYQEPALESNSENSNISGDATHRSPLEAWIAPWRDSDFRWVWFTRFLVALGFYMILTYANNYLTDVVKVFPIGPIKLKDGFQAAIVLALVLSLSGAVGSILGGKWADVVGRKKVISTAGIALFCILIPFALVPIYPVLLGLALCFGFFYGAYIAASGALAADALPEAEDTGKDLGIWQASISSTQIVSGLCGMLITWGNAQTMGLGYKIAFLVAACAFLIGALLVNQVKKIR